MFVDVKNKVLKFDSHFSGAVLQEDLGEKRSNTVFFNGLEARTSSIIQVVTNITTSDMQFEGPIQIEFEYQPFFVPTEPHEHKVLVFEQ